MALLLLFKLPDWPVKAPEPEAVKVEVVPPPKLEPPKPEPEKKEEKKADEPKPQPAPAAAASPQALTLPRPAADPQKELTSDEVVPAGKDETQDVVSKQQESLAEQRQTEAAPGASPIEAVPSNTAAELQSDTKPSDTAGQAKQQSPAPVPAARDAAMPQQKAAPQTSKSYQVIKPAGPKVAARANPFANMDQMFSSHSFSDPRDNPEFSKLPPTERIRRLCSYEGAAKASMRLGNARIDAFLPTGRAGFIMSKTSLTAKGGAFRNSPNWIYIDYSCSVDAALTHVVSFNFTIRGIVPREEWRVLGLSLN
ncbi:DUF930 domain-containing protein [Phyllobacterium sp. 628]|uniref:DUF930 domain-containing protein n=1 Tax=Phyllobacterium sp. 628 TaxID=2718938 RepID=UPI00166282BF|nr:DUF930 domain-containing protein [Phyllobacterium sp. 628]QND51667.1 DUF930 domain-containing protein [Phyllobacterium sp. 628]